MGGLGAGGGAAPLTPLCPQRRPACLACYKFDTSDVPKVLDKYHNCAPSHHLAVKVSYGGGLLGGLRGTHGGPGGAPVPPPSPSAPQEIKQRDEAECRAVEEAGKALDALYLPGMFAFSRAYQA